MSTGHDGVTGKNKTDQKPARFGVTPCWAQRRLFWNTENAIVQLREGREAEKRKLRKPRFPVRFWATTPLRPFPPPSLSKHRDNQRERRGRGRCLTTLAGHGGRRRPDVYACSWRQMDDGDDEAVRLKRVCHHIPSGQTRVLDKSGFSVLSFFSLVILPTKSCLRRG